MTDHVSDANSARRLTLSQKLALASGAGAVLAGIAAQQSAEAGIVQSRTLPMSPPASPGGIVWDVDDDGTGDFRLYNYHHHDHISASVTELGPARFVAISAVTSDGFAKLSAGFTVGGSMTGGFKFFTSRQSSISITVSGAIGGDAGRQGWAMGDIGYFGFKFTNTSGVHYGWGQIDIHGATGGFVVGQGFTFTQAYYNDTPGGSIQVGDVPEIDPASAGSVLSLVMGSLALLERRRLRRAVK
jgi:hypothetical protein